MSRLRISKARKQDYKNIEDIDALLDDIPEEPEEAKEEPEEAKEEPEGSNEDDEPNEERPKKSISVHLKGKRTVHIRELDVNMIPPHVEKYTDPEHTGSRLCLIGKPGTGKSTLIKSLLYEKSDFIPCCQIYSGTEDSNHSFSKFVPSSFIFNGFSQSSYLDFVRRQKIAKQYLENPWAAVVLDDCSEDEKIFNLPIIKGTYKNGRHWKMFHMLSLQYAMDIRPAIRTCIDGTFILRETNRRNRRILFEYYAACVDDFADFCDILDQITNDFRALYVHNRTQSNNIEDCLFWYKARDDIPEDFKFGCAEYWQCHNERYNNAYIDPIEV